MIRSMMKLAITAIAPLLLAACVTAGTGTVSTTVVTPSADVGVVRIQEYTARVCGYVPTAASVAAIAASFSRTNQDYVAIATRVAVAICNAVNPANAPDAYAGLRSARQLSVNGVPLQGRRIR